MIGDVFCTQPCSWGLGATHYVQFSSSTPRIQNKQVYPRIIYVYDFTGLLMLYSQVEACTERPFIIIASPFFLVLLFYYLFILAPWMHV